MANGKKSFVLYADLLKSVDHLTDEELGLLFKHILHYVNDLNPTLEDRLLLTAWKPIERSLKEDLKKWEGIKKSRSEAGKKGMKSRWSDNKAKQTITNITVNDNDNVNDTVINKEKNKNKKEVTPHWNETINKNGHHER
jgi:hypothetical protein